MSISRLLLSIVFALTLNCGCFALPQTDYKPGDKIKVLQSGEIVEVTVTRIQGQQIYYDIVDRFGREREQWTSASQIQSLTSSGNADYEVTSRTAVGRRTKGDIVTYPIRPWRKKNGEEFRARLKQMPTTSAVTLLTPEGKELQIDASELDEVDNTYLRKLDAFIKNMAGQRGRRGSGRRGPGQGRASAKPKRSEIAPPEMRSWNSRTGGHSIKAVYVSADDKKVKLKKEDGSTIDVEIDRLTATDQKYIRARVAATADASSEAVAADFSRSKSFSRMKPASAFSPDARLTLDAGKIASLAIPDRGDSMADIEKVLIKPDRNLAMVVCSSGLMNNRSTRLEMVNLKQQRVIGASPFPSTSGVPFGMTPDGTRVFSFTEQNVNNDVPRIERWKLVEGKIVRQNSVELVAGGQFSGRGGGHQGFVEGQRDKAHSYGVVNERTVSVQSMTELFVLDIETGVVLYVDQIQGFDPPAISANQKYMAFQPNRSNKILVVDCQTLQLAKTISAPSVDHLSFSDDGTKLACISREFENNAILIYDIASGGQVNEVAIPFNPREAFFSGNDYVVLKDLDDFTMVEVTVGYPVAKWKTFTTQTKGLVPLGDRKFLRAASGTGGEFLQVIGLPFNEWIDTDADEDKYYVPLKGNTVTIDLNGAEFNSSGRSKIKSAIGKTVTEAGGNVGSGGRIRIVAKTRPGTTKTVPYRERQTSGPGKVHNISYTPYINELIIYFDGEEIWKREVTSGGIGAASGTLAEIQRSTRESCKPSLEFFAGDRIPAKIPRQDAWDNIKTYQTQ